MNDIILLREEDRQELVKLYQEAQITPVLVFRTGYPDTAALAWDRVRKKMDELGAKYGFNPAEIKGIKSDTGEVVLK